MNGFTSVTEGIKCYGIDAKPVSGSLNSGERYSLKHVKGDPDSVFRFDWGYHVQLRPEAG